MTPDVSSADSSAVATLTLGFDAIKTQQTNAANPKVAFLIRIFRPFDGPCVANSQIVHYLVRLLL
jgi:hypothetical protein